MIGRSAAACRVRIERGKRLVQRARLIKLLILANSTSRIERKRSSERFWSPSNGGAMIPVWLRDVALASLAVGLVCAVVIAIDLIRHPQRMWIMNIVWPVNGLFGTVLTLWMYYQFGRLAARISTDTNEHSDSKKGTS